MGAIQRATAHVVVLSMHPRVQYAQWEGGSNSRWLEWRRVVLVAALLAVAVVTIESDLVPEIGHRLDGANWVAESKEQETTVRQSPFVGLE